MSSIPPPYIPPAPRKSKTGLIILIVILALVGICVGGLALMAFFGFRMWGSMSSTVGCIMILDQGRDAVIAYAKENNGVLPRSENWQQELRPRMQEALKELKSVPGMTVPDLNGPWVCDTADGRRTGVAYNSDLSGKKLADIENQAATVVLFEIPEARANAAQPYKPLDKESSPTIFGEKRGWMFIPLVGEGDFGSAGGSSLGTPSEGEPKEPPAPLMEKSEGSTQKGP